MRKPLLVAEDITTRRSLFRAFGVSWSATRYAWISPLSWATLGLAMAVADRRDGDGTSLLGAGLGYGAMLYGTNILHSVGHIIAGRAVGAPVQAVLLTSTRDVTIYTQPGGAAPARCRFGRALGGPVANMVIGCALMLAGHFVQASWIAMAGLVNVGVGVWTLMPVPSLDGWVIWSILIHSRRGGAA